MKHIFLFGYYGFQNIGDEVILQVITEQLVANIPNVKITALSYKAQETAEKYNISTVSRNSFRSVIKAIKKSDIVISGGGSILQDVTSARSLLYYLALIYIAKKMGKKVVFYGNGFGPITRSFNKKLVKNIINQVDLITVRDNESKDAMESLGIRRNIIVTADVAFALQNLEQIQSKSTVIDEKMDFSRKWVGISIREWKGEKVYKEAIARAGDYLMEKGYEVIFIPMQFPSDYRISEEVRNMMKYSPIVLEKPYSPKEILGLLGKLDIMIGMRLHSLIFSTIVNVPIIGLEYDAKISNFLKIVNQPSGGNVERLDFDCLKQKIDDMIQNHDYYEQRMKQAKIGLQEKAEENIKILKEFIEKGGKQ